MKKWIAFLLVFLIVLLGIIVVRAQTGHRSRSIQSQAELIQVNPGETADQLSKVIQFQTVSNFDRSKVNAAAFVSLQDFLESTFPLTHLNLQKQIVAEHSLIYTWSGSDPSLKPLLLMGHQDVVPVDEATETLWSHPPFSGAVSDGFIWGRGALDDKVNVIGILHAVERLIQENFVPRRTIYIAFGHDEEVAGNGAVEVAKLFQSKNIQFESVLDEGSVIYAAEFAGVKAPKAMIGIAEKGFMNLELSVQSEGGHSSMPPRETAVGILSAAIVKLQENPLPARLDSPAGRMMQELAPEMPFLYRALFRNLWLFKPLVVNALSKEASTSAQIRTTTAPTMLQGSPKDNVLAARAIAIINFRIVPGDTAEIVTQFVKETIDDPRVQIRQLQMNNPSPVSDPESEQFQIMAKSIREVFPDAIPVPALVVGATDSRHFTSLSPNVFRFSPVILEKDDLARYHGTNERLSVEGLARTVQFYAQYIRHATK